MSTPLSTRFGNHQTCGKMPKPDIRNEQALIPLFVGEKCLVHSIVECVQIETRIVRAS